MKPYTLTKSDYKEIYDKAVRAFNDTPTNIKQSYEHYLTRCLVASFTAYTKTKGLVVRNGELYVATED